MRHHLPKQAIDCPNCRTTHICGIQEDEDGPYVEIETHPCHADGCTTRLCTSCPQAECSECTLTHCEAHSIVTATGPVCPVCFAQLVEEGRTARELMAGEEPEDGQDGRDDLDDRDAHQIGSERCPPRE